MRTIKIKVSIQNHQLIGEVPAGIPDGDAEAVLCLPDQTAGDLQQQQRAHLASLSQRTLHRAGGRSLDDINRQIQKQRDSWDVR